MSSLPGAINEAAQRCRHAASTADQASGGARDWNGGGRGTMAATATPTPCSTTRETVGNHNSGGSAIGDVLSSEMVAQISQ
jgi:hypothetical protein